MCYVFCNHKCFVFPCLGAPWPSIPISTRTFFSHLLLLSMDILRFSFQQNCLNPTTPYPVPSCCILSRAGNFSASLLTALPLLLLAMQEAQHLSGPHFSQPGWSRGEIFWAPGLLMSVPYMVLQ